MRSLPLEQFGDSPEDFVGRIGHLTNVAFHWNHPDNYTLYAAEKNADPTTVWLLLKAQRLGEQGSALMVVGLNHEAVTLMRDQLTRILEERSIGA